MCIETPQRRLRLDWPDVTESGHDRGRDSDERREDRDRPRLRQVLACCCDSEGRPDADESDQALSLGGYVDGAGNHHSEPTHQHPAGYVSENAKQRPEFDTMPCSATFG